MYVVQKDVSVTYTIEESALQAIKSARGLSWDAIKVVDQRNGFVSISLIIPKTQSLSKFIESFNYCVVTLPSCSTLRASFDCSADT